MPNPRMMPWDIRYPCLLRAAGLYNACGRGLHRTDSNLFEVIGCHAEPYNTCFESKRQGGVEPSAHSEARGGKRRGDESCTNNHCLYLP